MGQKRLHYVSMVFRLRFIAFQSATAIGYFFFLSLPLPFVSVQGRRFSLFCVFTNIYFTQHLVRFLEQRFLLVQRAFIFHIFLFGFVEHGISCCFFAFLFVFFFNQTLATALTFGNSALGVLQKKPRCLLFPPHRHSVAVSRASVSCRCWCDWLCCKPRLPQILFLQVLRRYHTRQVAFFLYSVFWSRSFNCDSTKVLAVPVFLLRNLVKRFVFVMSVLGFLYLVVFVRLATLFVDHRRYFVVNLRPRYFFEKL